MIFNPIFAGTTGGGSEGGVELDSTTAPSDLAATAVAGNSTKASPANHIHKMPSAADVGAIATADKAAAGGVASLDETGKVPAGQLPSYVDDVLEFANFAALPETGTSGVIYVTLDTNLTYRWSGTVYTEISASVALTSTAPADLGTTAAPGDGTTAARSNHVHKMPSAADVGASTVALTASTPADLGTTAAAGDSTDAARANHVHKKPSAADIGALDSGGTAAAATTIIDQHAGQNPKKLWTGTQEEYDALGSYDSDTRYETY